jgi:hypothetical protein
MRERSRGLVIGRSSCWGQRSARSLLAVEVGEDGEDSAVPGVGYRQTEFGEDVPDVFVDCVVGDVQLGRDGSRAVPPAATRLSASMNSSIRLTRSLMR